MAILKTIFYEPLYNALVFLVSVIPGHDVGVAIILLTVLVRAILFPLGQKSVKSQIELRMIEPEIAKIKEEFKNNKEEQAKKTFELYRKHGVNPFSGCLLTLIQLPIIIALYYVFLKGIGSGALLDGGTLYSFITPPDFINTNFLGLIDITKKSLILALLAGLTQFIQAYLTVIPSSGAEKKSFKGDLMKSMQFQMKYFLPIFVFFIAYKISAGVALYWTISNIFMIAQEMVVRRKLAKKHEHKGVKILNP